MVYPLTRFQSLIKIKGQPYIELLGQTKIIVIQKKFKKKRKIFHLSLSDEKKYAVATVIIN
jgi:phosphopantetheinyl transferase (holo-ACP synthase)